MFLDLSMTFATFQECLRHLVELVPQPRVGLLVDMTESTATEAYKIIASWLLIPFF